MRIIANKKEDILKRKAEYEQQLADYNDRQQRSNQAMREAEEKVTGPVKEFLESRLIAYSALQFDVDVDRSYSGNGMVVNIRCNEDTKFEDTSALSWDYKACIEDGQVIKESSSWSGLKATTPDQMKSLRQTVAALEFLNDVDWYKLINVELPKYEDYYDFNDTKPQRPDFEQEIAEAEIEEIIGKNKAIKVKNWGESCPFKYDVFIRINKESPSQYHVDMVGCWSGSDTESSKVAAIEDFNNGDFRTQRVRKTSIKPVLPIQIIDIN